MELRDGQCPTFRKLGNNSITANTTVNTTEAGGEGPVEEGEKEDIFCAILTRGLEDKELCVDIAGENPAYRTPVLGYDCTGRWNQMFRLTENCTIMAEQPSVISRVRSKSDKAIVSCLDARHDSGVILTAECENLRSDLPLAGSMQQASNHTVEAAATEGATATVGVSASGEASPSQVQNATLGGRTAVPAVNWQLFQFMPASGTAFKAYMGGVGDSSSRGGEGVDNTLQQ